ncbi:hypothetical protein Cni_G07488 [Canna indica]|uniref:CAX-interacting protein 4 n=1 Tax=Canna indica TaxID=4628 RepID=A0AAQ3JYT1_9LILI|nr:hypothetical protein Cni_G07488 [Canna indica]
MPATAGRVRMPANNRVHSSAALQTHGIWQHAIGYDPYAPASKDSARAGEDAAAASAENAYANFQGLLALTRVTGSGFNEVRGACKNCGLVGHLTFQCRNFLRAMDRAAADKDKGHAALQAAATAEEEDDEEEQESDSSDSDADPVMEKLVAERFGMKSKRGTRDGEKGSHRHRGRDESDSDEEDERRKKRRRKHGHKHCRKSRKGEKRRSHWKRD